MKLNFNAWAPGISTHNTTSERPSDDQIRNGIAEKTCLIFLHGMGGTGQIWRPIAAQLEDEYACIAPDQRGHGKSRPLPTAENNSFHAMDYARDVIELLDHLAIRECFLIGHSMGVRTAMAVGESFKKSVPNRINGLIAVDIGITQSWGGGIGAPLAHFMEKLPRTFSDKTTLRDYLFANCPDPAIAQYLSAVAQKTLPSASSPNAENSQAEEWTFPFDHESLVKTIEQADEAPLEQWLIEIVNAGVKTKFLRGANSKVWLKPEYEMQKNHFLSLPNAAGTLTFEEWENCGHGLPFEQRARFIECVKNFTQKN